MQHKTIFFPFGLVNLEQFKENKTFWFSINKTFIQISPHYHRMMMYVYVTSSQKSLKM